MDELGNQLGAAVVVSAFLEALKKSNHFRFLNMNDSPRWKAFISFLAAFATTVGIHYTFDYNPSAGGVLTIAIPTVPILMHSSWDLAKQWAFQHFVYTAGIKDKTVNLQHVVPPSIPVLDAQGHQITGP